MTDIITTIYCVVAGFSVFGLAVAMIDGGSCHWTRPFAGFLWPLLAVIAIWIVWSRRHDR